MFIRKPTLKEWKIFYVIEEVALKNDAFINVLGNQEKRIGTIFKNLVYSNSMSKEMRLELGQVLCMEIARYINNK